MRDVFAIYDNNISSRLIIIIIKIMIQYFIQIRHTDDFPSTGTRLVFIILIISHRIDGLRLDSVLSILLICLSLQRTQN